MDIKELNFNNMKRFVVLFLIFFGIFMFFFIVLSNKSVKRKELYLIKRKLYKKTYLEYEFKGKIIEIKDLDISRQSWLIIKTNKKNNDINTCCKRNFIKKINDSILKIQFVGMLRFPNYHIKLKKNGVIYKNKGSSAVFYQYGDKTYLLSDIYCPDFSIVLFYSLKDYQYPCDSTIKKNTTSKYWYIVKDTLKKN